MYIQNWITPIQLLSKAFLVCDIISPMSSNSKSNSALLYKTGPIILTVSHNTSLSGWPKSVEQKTFLPFGNVGFGKPVCQLIDWMESCMLILLCNLLTSGFTCITLYTCSKCIFKQKVIASERVYVGFANSFLFHVIKDLLFHVFVTHCWSPNEKLQNAVCRGQIYFRTPKGH